MKNNNSINVFDVANYIITNNPTENTPITHMKLHKLIYYAQVYHLIFKDSPLILNKLQAWMHGPVFSELFPLFKKYEYHPITKITRKGNHSKIQGIYKESLDIIIRNLGKYNGQQLSDKTHSEEPWHKHFRSMGKNNILNSTLIEYYSKNKNLIFSYGDLNEEKF